MHNKELAELFENMATIYLYSGKENRFRAIAYQKAAKSIGNLLEDVEVYIKNNTLKNISGIGDGIAAKIQEFVTTGKVNAYEKLKEQVPLELIEMTEITGFGPKSLKQIHEELNISTKEELIKALYDGRVSKLKGFGSKKIENMLRGIKLHKTIEDRMLLWDALKVGGNILLDLKSFKEVKKAELAGSLRRKKETIGDIDILTSGKDKAKKKISDYFSSLPYVKQILAKGSTKVSVLLKDSGRQVDLRIVNEDEWGSALQYFTGSKEHNIHLRTIAKERGFKISEYGIFNLKNNQRLAGVTEEEIYQTLGFQTIPPEMREDKGEIELALKNQLPKLIEIDDIKGDLQMHSNWSDGTNTIEEIANYVNKKYNYEYIALTDHSKSLRVAKGMDEKQILKQLKAIKEVNLKLGKNFVKTGLELEILTDGSLDISDEILSQLDWVTAAIHQGFKKDNTDRIIRACENPYVHCIAHPTGRLIGSREPYKINMPKVIEVAKKMHTALEINAQPQRMDLNDELTMLARKNGVQLVISTDSHSFVNFDCMKLGVAIARRAWCTKEDILNSRSWKGVELFKKRKMKHLTLV